MLTLGFHVGIRHWLEEQPSSAFKDRTLCSVWEMQWVLWCVVMMNKLLLFSKPQFPQL